MKQQYVILRKENDWLSDYIGQTFTQRLNAKLALGLFEEHTKKLSNYQPQSAKALVYCMNPKTLEILSLGGSSLLKEVKTGKIIPDLILDNYGLLFARLIRIPAGLGVTFNLKDDAGVDASFKAYNGGNTGDATFNYVNGAGCGMGTQIKMGSGLSAVARPDFKIETSLPTAPESGYVDTNDAGYTAQNTVIYQGDANPTGGGGTVREIGTFGAWARLGVGCNINKIMISHDAVSPIVPYTSGKLLRGAYTWAF